MPETMPPRAWTAPETTSLKPSQTCVQLPLRIPAIMLMTPLMMLTRPCTTVPIELMTPVMYGRVAWTAGSSVVWMNPMIVVMMPPTTGAIWVTAFMIGVSTVGMIGMRVAMTWPMTGISAATNPVTAGMICWIMPPIAVTIWSNVGFNPSRMVLNCSSSGLRVARNTDCSCGLVAMSAPRPAVSMPSGPPSMASGPLKPPSSPPSSGILDNSGAMPPAPSARNAAPIGASTVLNWLASPVILPMACWMGSGRILVISPSMLGREAIRLLTMTPMRGPMFLMTVPMLVTSWLVSLPMSASFLPSSVSQFCQAAFMLPTEPSMVVEASLAVVPVMPRLFWTSWMACTTSLNLSMLRSPAWPLASRSLLASKMRRSISVLVPPYPSLRLSSIW